MENLEAITEKGNFIILLMLCEGAKSHNELLKACCAENRFNFSVPTFSRRIKDLVINGFLEKELLKERIGKIFTKYSLTNKAKDTLITINNLISGLKKKETIKVPVQEEITGEISDALPPVKPQIDTMKFKFISKLKELDLNDESDLEEEISDTVINLFSEFKAHISDSTRQKIVKCFNDKIRKYYCPNGVWRWNWNWVTVEDSFVDCYHIYVIE